MTGHTAPWILYGASGYTGRRIAHEACRRGLQPILAGRTAAKIEILARRLGRPSQTFALDRPEQIAAQIRGTKAVLHCAGPFSATAAAMMDACLAARVHYLDITGEIDVIEAAAARHEAAVAAGVTLMPAVGFDVVPSDSLAAMLAARLPGSVKLELAFSALGRLSPGTAKTMLESLPYGGRARIDGRIVRVSAAWKSLEVPHSGGPRRAVSVPWGDVASAWYSTGIPNIETYLVMSPGQERAMRIVQPLRWVLRPKMVQALGRWLIDRLVQGPTDQEQNAARVEFWGRASDAAGRNVAATLDTPGGYSLTVVAALACLENVLADRAPVGFVTPSKAFGADFGVNLPGCRFRWMAKGQVGG